MTSRLENAPSAYLNQHKDQPVSWWPWGPEALAEAKKQNKPLLISIGYASCHWCHVMAHESFEDPFIAEIMNRHFICIKVDREEHPDVDALYIEAVQMIQQHAGWPLNVFCFPDGRPFFGGTYFPAKDNGQGIVPWPQLLMRIADFYQKNQKELEENADNIVKNLTLANAPTHPAEEKPNNASLITAAKHICTAHDDAHGGFGNAPKFPPSMVLSYLLTIRKSKSCEAHPALTARIDQVTITTLNAMAQGGIYDQIGGGFARYSVDTFWHIPHFEKMLYDNALLASTYAQGYLEYQKPLYKATLEETVNFLLKELWDETAGLFAASLDADTPEGEGYYYSWTPAEVEAVLGNRAASFCDAYSITESGNFEEGRSVPIFKKNDWELRQELQPQREALLKARELRTRPNKDAKYITAWNALAIEALVHASGILEISKMLTLAKRAADTLWQMFEQNGKLTTVAGAPQSSETLADYAYLAKSYLTLAARIDIETPGQSQIYIKRAEILTRYILKHFKDPHLAGFFFSTNKDLIVHKKEWWDQAIPSSNGALMHVFSVLWALTGKAEYQEEFASLKQAFSGPAAQSPNGTASALIASVNEAMGIPILKIDTQKYASEIKKILSKTHRPLFIIDTGKSNIAPNLCIGTQCIPISETDINWTELI